MEPVDCRNKRLLILGGSGPYRKVVQAAREMGVYTIVVDRHASSGVKQLADMCISYDLLDVEGILAWCRENPVDGVMNFCVDFAQKTQLKLAKALGLPCSYEEDQVRIFSDKSQFKKVLVESGLSVIPSYSEEDIETDRVEYPILIKPAESSGSRGSMICEDRETARAALVQAKETSRNGKAVLEKYMQDAQEFQFTYFLVNGKVYLIRTADSYEGSKADRLERVVACGISPSRYTDEYVSTTHEKVVSMFRKLGLKNGPCFMQGFYDHGVFRFFDPGMRFPGVDYDRVYQREFGVDLAKLMVELALTGKIAEDILPDDMARLNGKTAAVLFPFMKAGNFTSLAGEEILRQDARVFSYSLRHEPGSRVEWTYDVNQRLAEIDLIGADKEDLREAIKRIQTQLHALDQEGREMRFSPFDVYRF